VHRVICRTNTGLGMEANTERCRCLVLIAVLPAQELVQKMSVLPHMVCNSRLLRRSVFDMWLVIPRTLYYDFW
jgi:hypothetical protein